MKFILDERYFLLEDTEPDELDDAEDLEDDTDELDSAEDIEADDYKSGDKIDWASWYNEARKTKETDKKFWYGDIEAKSGTPEQLGYLEYEWPGHGQFIDKLGILFTETLTKYGWTEIENPYVSYLRTVFYGTVDKGMSEIKHKDYKAIKEAVDSGLLSEDDLRGKGKLKFLNMIFTLGFLTANALDQKKYLQLQRKLVNNWPASLKGTDKQGTLIKAIFFSAKPEDEIYQIANGKSFAGTTNTLRPYPALNQLIINLTGSTEEEDEEDAEVDDVKLFGLENKLKSIDKAEAKQLLAYTLRTYRSQHKKIFKQLNSKYSLGLDAIYKDIPVSEMQAEKFDALMGKSNYKADTMANLILLLAKQAGLN